MKIKKYPPLNLKGEFIPPGDKSISHRAIFLGAISDSTIKVRNFLFCDDCIRTINAFQNMGVDIKQETDIVIIKGVGLYGLQKPNMPLYLGNSGTTMRLLLGLLSAQNFEAILTGDKSLSRRPMRRVTEPLTMMGAIIEGPDNANFAPLKVKGAKLKAISYRMPIASAQVKSALMFAGLYADGIMEIIEPLKSRDHTERMLKAFGAQVEVSDFKISLKPHPQLRGSDFVIPGDISSASFFITLAMLLPNSELTIRNVGLNPTRLGFIEVLKRMGADIEIELEIPEEKSNILEPVGKIVVRTSELRATTIEREEIPLLIDEIPLLVLIASFAHGTTKICEAGELRVKETDRINSIYQNLSKMGAKIEIAGNDIIIKGKTKLTSASLLSYGDHRTAMVSFIASLLAQGDSELDEIDCIKVSFPQFISELQKLLNDRIKLID